MKILQMQICTHQVHITHKSSKCYIYLQLMDSLSLFISLFISRLKKYISIYVCFFLFLTKMFDFLRTNKETHNFLWRFISLSLHICFSPCRSTFLTSLPNFFNLSLYLFFHKHVTLTKCLFSFELIRKHNSRCHLSVNPGYKNLT